MTYLEIESNWVEFLSNQILNMWDYTHYNYYFTQVGLLSAINISIYRYELMQQTNVILGRLIKKIKIKIFFR